MDHVVQTLLRAGADVNIVTSDVSDVICNNFMTSGSRKLC